MGKVLEASYSSTTSDGRDSPTRRTDKPVRELCLSKLLHSIVWNKKRYEGELSMAQVGDIVRTILKATLRVTKSHPAAEEQVLHVAEELKLFLQAQKKRLTDDVAGPALPLRVLSSSLHVSLASRLVDSRLSCFPRPSSWTRRTSTVKEARERRLLHHACGQLHLAEKQLAPALTDGRRLNACCYAQCAAVQLQHAVLLEHLSLAKLTRDGDGTEESSTPIPSTGIKYVSAVITSRWVACSLHSQAPRLDPSCLAAIANLLFFFVV
jgi:hypothetical protein